MGYPNGGDPVPLPTWQLTDRVCSPSPVWINHSLPPYVDAMDDALSLDPGTHHDNGGNRAFTPFARGKISRKRLEKEKAPQGRLFDSFALSAGKR